MSLYSDLTKPCAQSIRLARIAVLFGSLALVTGSISGCKVGPNYHPPAQAMPSHWESPPTTQASVTVQQPVEVERWWTTFADPELNSLIHRAVQSNLDIQAATERIREARANITGVRAGLFPFLNGSASETRNFSAAPPSNSWRAGLDASWELDIFGGTRRAVEAANANYQASIEDRRDVLVTLLGEVASDYIQLRGFQQEIITLNRSLDIATHTANIAREHVRLGTGTGLDIAQADSEVVNTRAQIIALQTSVQQTMYAISTLLGLPPTELDAELSPVAEIPAPPAEVPVGLPSELLRRRPDIRRAERQLAAATADIGVATSDLFPKFSLTAGSGFASSRIQSLGNWNNRFLSFGPSVSTPLFDAGRIFSNIEVQKAVTAQNLTNYRRTVLNALQEVQNALVAFANEQQHRVLLAQIVALDQRAVDLSTERYNRGGLTDFTSVLVAEQSLFGAQNALVRSSQDLGVDAVAVYKALGGGWDIEEMASPAPGLSKQESSHPASAPSAAPTTYPVSP
jgi:outer membrane protein, multidrug efflux system